MYKGTFVSERYKHRPHNNRNKRIRQEALERNNRAKNVGSYAIIRKGEVVKTGRIIH